MANRAAVAAALAELGFVAVQPEQLAFERQVALLAGAELIVSEFGAAMTNVLFAHPAAKVIEIIPENQSDLLGPSPRGFGLAAHGAFSSESQAETLARRRTDRAEFFIQRRYDRAEGG